MNPALKLILYPFSRLYMGIVAIRNLLYDKNIFKSTQFDLPVIGVGNITVGGTGKTPMVEFLIEHLHQRYNIGTISRGYGRKIRGFRIANMNDDAKTIGDEPFQLYTKYKHKIAVAVGEERVLAVPQLLYSHPEIQLILLDDAFQHRSIRPVLQIMLTDFSQPFYNDITMPAGRLRESRAGAKRADTIVVTKCPKNLNAVQKKAIEAKIIEYSGPKQIFFSTLNYGEPYNITDHNVGNLKKVVLLSGIANPRALVAYVEMKYELKKHFSFQDHHNYTLGELKNVEHYISKNCPEATIITTEKDSAKLRHFLKDIDVPIFVLPVRMQLLDNEAAFFDLIGKAAVYNED